MVSTRQHPSPFPPPELAASLQSSPTKQSSPSKRAVSKRSSLGASTTTTSTPAETYSHTPTKVTLAWLAISLPLVIWDTGYVLLRPHSMPGGKLHSPIWTPYALYGTIDYVYGWPAYNANNGFTGAQGAMNLVETTLYFVYLGLVYGYGTAQKDQGDTVVARLLAGKTLTGKTAATATLLLFGTALMTLSKTVLYWLNEAFSGFHSIGHNDLVTLIFYWIVPNGLWLIFPSWIIYKSALEIVDSAAGAASKKTQ